MANSYTALTKKEGNWWIGWVEALQFNRDEAIKAAAPAYAEVKLVI